MDASEPGPNRTASALTPNLSGQLSANTAPIRGRLLKGIGRTNCWIGKLDGLDSRMLG